MLTSVNERVEAATRHSHSHSHSQLLARIHSIPSTWAPMGQHLGPTDDILDPALARLSGVTKHVLSLSGNIEQLLEADCGKRYETSRMNASLSEVSE